MIFRYPDYYEKFSCIAGACEDTCCAGWEIDIDDKSYEYYKTVGGAFGEMLRQNIKEYENDEEEEAAFHKYNERGRFGQWDLKHETLRRDNFCCQKCGRKVTAETSAVDHIKPVNCFANFQLASKPENLQTLCLQCHKDKHR